MRYMHACAVLAGVLGVGVCAAQEPGRTGGPAVSVSSPARMGAPEIYAATMRAFELAPTASAVTVTRAAPMTRPFALLLRDAGTARSMPGPAQPIPTDVRAAVMLLPTDTQHQVTLCIEPTGR